MRAFGIMGDEVTGWNTFTPTGTQTTAVTYTGSYRLIGGALEMHVNMAYTNATSGTLEIFPPTGMTFSALGLAVPVACGVINAFRATTYYTGVMYVQSAGVLRAVRSGATGLWGNSEPAVPTNGDWNSIHVIVPIVGGV